ncbi:MAG: HlyD family efflux transporter periplasmic adaptor subunit [Saprospiraceae bacterium]|nr:HlyD family efflux transporter periplasmic adaptor subunit [Saprospiraceae bacterium]
MKNHFIFYLLTTGLLAGCASKKVTYDASGVFEAKEIVISAEANGQLLDLNVEEGSDLKANELVGKIECSDMTFQKSQIEATMEALKLKRGDASPEISIVKQQIETQKAQILTIQTQLSVMSKERDRIKKLVKEEAAPSQQLDDLQGQVDILSSQKEAAESQIAVLERQMDAQKDMMTIKNRAIMSEEKPLASNVDRIENLLQNCEIVNPAAGTVLAQYVEQFEYVNMGKALYKIANLKAMILRAYLSGDQLSSIQLGQEVNVLVDKSTDEYLSYKGRITWIADQAEFTPKTIQTKNERANLVYAVKITVENDGFIRVGMYGEVQI